MEDLNIVVAGAAGEGIQTVGGVLAQAALSQGYAVFSWQEFESRVRGGHSRFCVRIGENIRNAPLEKADILIGLNDKAVEKYKHLVKGFGIVIGPNPILDDMIAVPFSKISKEKLGHKIYANTIAAGALSAALGKDLEAVFEVLDRRFEKKGTEVAEKNRQAARLGYEEGEAGCKDSCPWKLPKLGTPHFNLGGHQAVAIGAARAGCRFMSAYPMSPSTDIITYLAEENHLGVFVEQAEDEIAAVNMAIGASFAGARAMTASAGGGFALMVESVSLSGMIEVPVVIVVAQRPGPATGLPTRTSQADLLFAVHSGHGEFPKMVLAPSDPFDCFEKTVRAFNLADHFQVPVIVLTDQFLADSTFSFDSFPIHRAVPETFIANPKNIDAYKRYELTEDGISPRLYPGQSNHLVGADSDEHDEFGHITEDLEGMALSMVKKRQTKFENLRKEIARPEELDVEKADIVIVGWGSSRNSIREAKTLLEKDGVKTGIIHFTEMWPLPFYQFEPGKRYFTVEGNSNGQLAKLLRSEYDVEFAGHVGRIDGLPLTAEFIRSRLP
jgi:2-oxoglutarate ferredoxin oxidoreductase subunit alpha